jgi:phage terminase large subunit-like protein
MISGGDVFVRLRDSVINGKAQDTGWAEWSIEEQTENVDDVNLWYKYNPSLGTILSERNIHAELAGDPLDFNIQRLGLWIKYNQKSAISEDEWMELKTEKKPKLEDGLFLGIKYGRDGANVAMSIAAKTTDGKVFVETIDCVSVRAGNSWMFDYFKNPKVQKIAVDGASGQQTLADQMKDMGFKKPILPAVREVVLANNMFEQGLYAKQITHSGQESLKDVVSNCEKRAIGSNGGFGYRSLVETYDIAIMDSMILAYWLCATTKDTPSKQSISY